MTRPIKCRRVDFIPDIDSFLPVGREESSLEYTIKVEELEAMRLKDVEGLSQEECAEKMHISRQTFQKILESVRKKLALALINGAAIRITGGYFAIKGCQILCNDCGHAYDPDVEEDKFICPECGSRNTGCVRKNPNCKKWCTK
jgi:uncharacterized protein